MENLTQEKDGKLKLRLKSKSGFTSEVDAIISSEQWFLILSVCNNKSNRLLMAAPDLLAALEDLLSLYRAQWGDNETTMKAHNAIAKAIRTGGQNNG